MNLLFPASSGMTDKIQSRLLKLAAAFVVVNAIVLTLSPSVRYHSWAVAYRWQHWAGVILWLAAFALIHRYLVLKIPDRDPYLVPLAAILTGWGLLSIWRLDSESGLRQSLWLILCAGLFIAGLRIKNLIGLLRRYKYFWLTTGLLITGLTFIFGTYPGGEGPRLWLGCCGLYFQPSEPLKMLLVIYLAAYLADQIPLNFNFIQMLLPTFLLVGAALGILLIQRDLGTASLFLLLYFTIIFLASGRSIILAAGGISLVAAGVIGYMAFDVIRIRVDAWLNPWVDPSGRSFQIVQSLMAIANGQILGRGLGIGSPGFVPISHSDFIFSAIGEEYGLAGTLGLLLILILFISRGFRISIHAANRYHRFLAAGATAYIVLQSIFIIGGNIRLLPLTGVTLPFVSYGGSSLLTSFFTLLVLILISSKTEEDPAPIGNSRPFLFTSGLLLISIIAASLINGWWSFIRSDDLLTRIDNPRRSAVSLFVKRGSILDRNNNPIVVSAGEPGNYIRENLYPALSLVTGYSDPIYGQAGIESSMDSYLRGLQGSPTSTILVNQLLYDQPPPGLNVRLSIDLKLQAIVDGLLNDQTGAAVMLNAETGEILAMASHPYFNSNEIDTSMEDWIHSDQGYLLNRATQSSYPPGIALGAFVLADYLAEKDLSDPPNELTLPFNNQTWYCARFPNDSRSWGELISRGCPAALAEIGREMGSEKLANLYEKLGFTESPSIPLPVAPSSPKSSLTNSLKSALGQDAILVTPLQMALAAATLSREGGRPSPLLAMAVDTPQQGWVILPNDPVKAALSPDGVSRALNLLASPSLPIWETSGFAFNGENQVSWYIAGTLPGWKGTPIAIAVALENQEAASTFNLGHNLFKTTITP